MKNTESFRVNCGDWHLGWGLSGNDKIGNLSRLRDGSYLWEGYSQGRHGQKWNRGAKLTFKVIDDNIEVISSVGNSPRVTEVLKSVEELERKLGGLTYFYRVVLNQYDYELVEIKECKSPKRTNVWKRLKGELEAHTCRSIGYCDRNEWSKKEW